MGLHTGIKIESLDVEVTHFQLVDDSIVFLMVTLY